MGGCGVKAFEFEATPSGKILVLIGAVAWCLHGVRVVCVLIQAFLRVARLASVEFFYDTGVLQIYVWSFTRMVSVLQYP